MILVALITCRKAEYQDKRVRCMTTWARQLPVGYEFLAVDGETFETSDDYAGLSDKVWNTAKYAAGLGYDWLLKVDDDVWLKPWQLKVPPADYAGRVLERADYNYCAGGCYWLSKRAIDIVARAERNTENTSAEDQWVGRILDAEGIKPHYLRDFVIEPCRCTHCDQVIPRDWTAYIQQKSGRPARSFPPAHYLPS